MPMLNTGMRAWATKATISSTWLADLFLNSHNLQKFVYGDISGTIPPVFDKREIRIRYGSCGGHKFSLLRCVNDSIML